MRHQHDLMRGLSKAYNSTSIEESTTWIIIKFSTLTMTFQKTSTVLLVVANLLVIPAIIVFASGFFPHKPFLPGRAIFEGVDEVELAARAPFNKVIFMVVDALRRFGFATSVFPFKLTGQ